MVIKKRRRVCVRVRDEILHCILLGKTIQPVDIYCVTIGIIYIYKKKIIHFKKNVCICNSALYCLKIIKYFQINKITFL